MILLSQLILNLNFFAHSLLLSSQKNFLEKKTKTILLLFLVIFISFVVIAVLIF